eukprot:gene8673-9556_t
MTKERLLRPAGLAIDEFGREQLGRKMSIGSSSYSPSVNAAIKRHEALERREKGFSLTGLQSVQLKEYNALYDPNMRHYFESRHNQYLLYRTGQIDSNGRVINLDKNKSKLAILEREFREAEKIEEKRQKEELEMRYRVQRKRFNALETMRKSEILEKLKAERDLSKEILSTLYLSSTGGYDGRSSLSRSRSQSMKRSSRSPEMQQQPSDSFFLTSDTAAETAIGEKGRALDDRRGRSAF